MSETLQSRSDLVELNDVERITTFHEKPWGETVEENAQLVLDIAKRGSGEGSIKILHWPTKLTAAEALTHMREFVQGFDIFVFYRNGAAFLAANEQAREAGLDNVAGEAFDDVRAELVDDWEVFAKDTNGFLRVDAAKVGGQEIAMTFESALETDPDNKGYRLLDSNHFGLRVDVEVSYLELPVTELLTQTLPSPVNIEPRLNAIDAKALAP